MASEDFVVTAFLLLLLIGTIVGFVMQYGWLGVAGTLTVLGGPFLLVYISDRVRGK